MAARRWRKTAEELVAGERQCPMHRLSSNAPRMRTSISPHRQGFRDEFLPLEQRGRKLPEDMNVRCEALDGLLKRCRFE